MSINITDIKHVRDLTNRVLFVNLRENPDNLQATGAELGESIFNESGKK